MNVGFQFFNCNPNNKFDLIEFLDPGFTIPNPNHGKRIGTDLCLDVNKEVKRSGFYSTTEDELFINDDETLSDADWIITRTYSDGDVVVFFDVVDRFYESKINGNIGNTPPTAVSPDEDGNWKELTSDPREILTALTGKTMTITLTRVCAELPVPTTGIGVCPASGDVDPHVVGPLSFHEHSDGMTSWYHIPIETGTMLTGHYKAEIIVDEEGTPRTLYDYNTKLFNAGSGKFVNAILGEVVPSGSITGFDETGNKVTFLFDVLEAPAP